MHKSFVRLVAICTAPLAAAALLVAGSSSASAAASYGQYLYPLAGDSQYLVYSQSHSAGASRSFNGCSKGSPTLHVRDRAGHTSKLPVPHNGSSYGDYTNPCLGMYLNGDLLTLDGISGTRDPIYWWDLKTHRHGSVRLPENNNKITFLGNVPGGWIYAPMDYSNKNYFTATRLYRQGTGGKVTTFAKLPRFFAGDVAMSTRGFVTGNDVTADEGNPLRYRTYGSTALKTLDVPANKYLYNGCDAVTATFVACHSINETDSGKYLNFQASITPLSGKATITNTSAFDPKVGTLIADVAPSATPGGLIGLLAPTKTTSLLRSFRTNGQVNSAPAHGATAMVIAYGQIALSHTGGQITLQSSVKGTQHIVLH